MISYENCGDDVSKLTADERDRLIQLGPYARSLTSSYDKLRKMREELGCARVHQMMRAMFRYTPAIEQYSGTAFDEATLQVITALGPQLRTLVMIADDWGLERAISASRLLQLLERYPLLETLSLKDFMFSEGALSGLQKLKGIRELSLKACIGMPDDAIDRIAEYLPQLQKLSVDSLDDMTEEGAEMLNSLSRFTDLLSLELNGFRISDAHMQHIGKLVKLEALLLHSLEFIGAAGLKALARLNLKELTIGSLSYRMPTEALDALFGSQKNLRKFTFVSSENGSFSAEKLRGLADCQALSMLDLTDVRHLNRDTASWISELQALEQVTLSRCNSIGKTVLEAFSKLPLLRGLNLDNTDIDTKHVSDDWALPQLKRLVANWSLKNADMACRLLQGSQELEVLVIQEYTPLGQYRAINAASLQRIGTMRKLVSLHIDTNTTITGKMLESLYPLKELQRLVIKCGNGDKIDVKELQRQFPNTKIIVESRDEAAGNSASDVSGTDSSDSDREVSGSSSSDSSSGSSSSESSASDTDECDSPSDSDAE